MFLVAIVARLEVRAGSVLSAPPSPNYTQDFVEESNRTAFGSRQPDGNLGIGADHGDDHHEEALRLQNDEAVRRATPLTSQQSR
jgi:hypothetical protein